MPKKLKLIPERAPSKLQLSKWERQKKLQRLVMLAGALIIVVIAGLLSFGYYDFKIKPALAEKNQLAQAAFSVNDKVYTKERLVNTVVLSSFIQGGTNQIDVAQLTGAVSYLQELEVAAQEADKLGTKVSTEEINERLKGNFPIEEFGFTEADYRQLLSRELLKDKLKKEHLDVQVPAEEMQVQVERVLLRTKEEAEKVAGQLKEGAAFAAVKDLSLDPASREKDGNTGWISRDQVSKTLEEVAFGLKKNEVSQPFFDEGVFIKGGYWLIRLTEKVGENIKAQGIVLRTQEEAVKVKERLDKGEEFATLAKELSQDFYARETGGDLGTISKGSYSPEFEQIAFGLGPAQIGGPVFDSARSIKGGYWVVRAVEQSQMRPLEKPALESRQAQFFRKWLDEKKSDYRIESTLSADEINQLKITAEKRLSALTRARKNK